MSLIQEHRSVWFVCVRSNLEVVDLLNVGNEVSRVLVWVELPRENLIKRWHVRCPNLLLVERANDVFHSNSVHTSIEVLALGLERPADNISDSRRPNLLRKLHFCP